MPLSSDYQPPREPTVEPDPSPEASLATLDQVGQATVATVTSTELSGTMAMHLIEELFEHLQTSGSRHFVLDLQNVRYMDSACVGALVELLNKMQRLDGRIAIVNAAQSVEYLFKLTRLDRVFPLCRDVITALAVVERGS
ncbi:MAG: STAS domain-containing protein [Phycisphaerales bacterium]|nr:STAS domain-containing protein [Phycisphaerales bacterium]